MFLSASALFWLLHTGMVVVDGGICGGVKFRGANHDLRPATLPGMGRTSLVLGPAAKFNYVIHGVGKPGWKE